MNNKQEKQEYARYIRAYQNKVDSLVKKGLSTADVQERLKFNEWKITYEATKNTKKSDVALGKSKYVGDINTAIVDRQAYTYTDKQADAMIIAAERTGQNLTKEQIRTGAFDWTQINEYYDELRANGIAPTDASHMISQYFFGSN